MSDDQTGWKDYELFIKRHFEKLFPDARIRHDVMLPGLKSRTERQVDLLIEADVASFGITIAIDCKYFRRKVDVKHVEEFLGLLNDLKISKGVIITNKGYSKAAYERATYETRDVELRILDFSELEQFQRFVAIPYFGRHAALISAPPGWIIDVNPPGPHLAVMHPLGTTAAEAFHYEAFVYIDASMKDSNWPTLDTLLAVQSTNIYRHYADPKVQLDEVKIRDDGPTVVRTLEAAEIPNTTECTVFVEFESAIMYMNLMSPTKDFEQNQRKLFWVVEKLQRLEVKRHT